MTILDTLDPRYVILARGPAATGAQVAELRSALSVAIPDEYVEVVAEATDIELRVDGKRYLRIWGPRTILDQIDGYPFQRYIPSAIPIGDDGGGNALVYMDGSRGFGLYLVDYGDIDADSARFIASGLEDLLVAGIGL